MEWAPGKGEIMDTTSVGIDSLLKSMPADSASAFVWLGQVLPGINPAIAMLIASWIATRGIWLIKLLINAMKIVGPGPISPIFQQIQKIWQSLAWILNPLIMYLVGKTLTGSDPLSLLFTFAGIGVREWLVKSPIPTSKGELMKLKAAVIFVLALVPFLFVGNVQAQTATPLGTLPNWVSIAIGGGHTSNFHDGNTVNSPWVGGRVGYIQSKHLKFELEGRYIFETQAYSMSNYSQLTVAGYIVF